MSYEVRKKRIAVYLVDFLSNPDDYSRIIFRAIRYVYYHSEKKPTRSDLKSQVSVRYPSLKNKDVRDIVTVINFMKKYSVVYDEIEDMRDDILSPPDVFGKKKAEKISKATPDEGTETSEISKIRREATPSPKAVEEKGLYGHEGIPALHEWKRPKIESYIKKMGGKVKPLPKAALVEYLVETAKGVVSSGGASAVHMQHAMDVRKAYGGFPVFDMAKMKERPLRMWTRPELLEALRRLGFPVEPFVGYDELIDSTQQRALVVATGKVKDTTTAMLQVVATVVASSSGLEVWRPVHKPVGDPDELISDVYLHTILTKQRLKDILIAHPDTSKAVVSGEYIPSRIRKIAENIGFKELKLRPPFMRDLDVYNNKDLAEIIQEEYGVGTKPVPTSHQYLMRSELNRLAIKYCLVCTASDPKYKKFRTVKASKTITSTGLTVEEKPKEEFMGKDSPTEAEVIARTKRSLLFMETVVEQEIKAAESGEEPKSMGKRAVVEKMLQDIDKMKRAEVENILDGFDIRYPSGLSMNDLVTMAKSYISTGKPGEHGESGRVHRARMKGKVSTGGLETSVAVKESGEFVTTFKDEGSGKFYTREHLIKALVKTGHDEGAVKALTDQNLAAVAKGAGVPIAIGVEGGPRVKEERIEGADGRIFIKTGLMQPDGTYIDRWQEGRFSSAGSLPDRIDIDEEIAQASIKKKNMVKSSRIIIDENGKEFVQIYYEDDGLIVDEQQVLKGHSERLEPEAYHDLDYIEQLVTWRASEEDAGVEAILMHPEWVAKLDAEHHRTGQPDNNAEYVESGGIQDMGKRVWIHELKVIPWVERPLILRSGLEEKYDELSEEEKHTSYFVRCVYRGFMEEYHWFTVEVARIVHWYDVDTGIHVRSETSPVEDIDYYLPRELLFDAKDIGGNPLDPEDLPKIGQFLADKCDCPEDPEDIEGREWMEHD